MASKAKAEWITDLKKIHKERAVFFRPRVYFTRLAGIWKGAASFHYFIIINPKLKEAIPEARHYLLAHEYGHVYKGHFFKAVNMMVSLGVLCTWLGAAWIYVNAYLYFLGIVFFGCLFYHFDQKHNLTVADEEADNFALELKESEKMYKGCHWVGEKLNDLDNKIRKNRLEKFKKHKE